MEECARWDKDSLDGGVGYCGEGGVGYCVILITLKIKRIGRQAEIILCPAGDLVSFEFIYFV